MKKFLFVCCMMVVSMTASAQFTVYRSIYSTPQQSYTPSSGYGVPFSTYQPYQSSSYRNPYQEGYRVEQSQTYQQQPARPRMQEVTLKGYYKKGDDWYYTPIRVGVIGNEEVRVLSVKTQHGWMNCGNAASSVGAFDSEVIRDNFNYKAYTTIYGTIYF